MQERVIQAAIINHTQDKVVIDEQGNLPELRFHPVHGTTEGTLFALGRTVLQNVSYVSVDHASSQDGKLLYQTKPVPPHAQPGEAYRWGDTPDGVTLI